ncbi:uncharacterized protein [Physcomitrium patens]|uniref:Uncharacterized protein n=1 Tax=Physcomitrium patens TaxID=3218 RepID=A0A2K1INP5_PHYPA|nr:uncharacterized protein LOC112274868 [Physcomitrium patens]XP_024360462.1 uncharacterized protein LOC112274868 [Physcomitrium patens]PNR30887.1 hypothetical protein PHYPA_027203 [Physcomitrium patens]|eukprot:XP_024360460.1 uncharacterized protein LOC112274868 [Physcomitrella patens]
MDYCKKYVDDVLLQVGMLVSAAVAAMSWCLSNSANATLSTYITCLLPALLIIVPDWTYFMRGPGDWSDVVFVEPVVGSTKQIRRLEFERDMELIANGTWQLQDSRPRRFR